VSNLEHPGAKEPRARGAEDTRGQDGNSRVLVAAVRCVWHRGHAELVDGHYSKELCVAFASVSLGAGEEGVQHEGLRPPPTAGGARHRRALFCPFPVKGQSLLRAPSPLFFFPWLSTAVRKP
jgi:hypothetical protein